jgi:formamidopyrimidine-DNA glycosylase
VPELPEVEVVRAGLEPAVVGAQISGVTVFDARALRRHGSPSEDFVARLTGRGILSAERRGKFIWLPLTRSVELVETPRGSPSHPPRDERTSARARSRDR